jgi:four helix bundle protein
MSKFSNKVAQSYDLEERTARFGEDVIDAVKRIKRDVINDSLIKQLVKSATSIGANYCEANNASSKSDFRNKIYICKKEANETKYWLRMLTRTNPELKDTARKLWQEAQELNLIFQKIVNSLSRRKSNI